MQVGRFLAGIAGLVRNAGGAYLLLERVAERDFGGGAWECVTGRVNQGESFEQALHREVLEETGLRVSIDFIVSLTHFQRGGAAPEQELQGVTFSCSTRGDETVTLSPEHAQYRWLTAGDALSFLVATDPGTRWFRRTINRGEKMSQLVSPDWVAIHRAGATLV